MAKIRIMLAALVAFGSPAFAQYGTSYTPGTKLSGITHSGPNGGDIIPLFVLSDTTGSPLGGTATSTSVGGTTSATANTYTSVLAANTSRKGCLIQNTSANVELAFLGAPGSATTATSISIPAGGTFNCASPGGLVISDQISLTSATASSTYVVVSQ